MENLEVQGQMVLEVRDAASGCLVVKLSQGDTSGFQFKTHPNIDKAMYSNQATLGLKDPARPFPTGSGLGVLKWRMQTKDEDKVGFFFPEQRGRWGS